MLGDLAATAAAGLFSFWVRTWFGPLNEATYLSLAPLMLLVPLKFINSGLYPGYGINPVEQLRRIARSVSITFLLVLALTYMFKVGTTRSRFVVAGWWLGSMVLIPLMRALLRALLARTRLWGRSVVVLGAARTGEKVISRLTANPGLGLRPVVCLDDDPAKHGTACAGVPVAGPLSLAPEVARSHGITMAVVAMPGLSPTETLRVVEHHAAAFRRVLVIPDLRGLTSLCTTAIDLRGVLGLELQQNLLCPWNRAAKRAMDLAITVPALLVAGPLIGLLGLLVKLFSPGPAFYSQTREGLGGKPIRVWKLRTMVPDAEAVLHGYLAENPAAKAEWDQYMKLRHDPRIVPVIGNLLRRLSLDELPQLWNIVRGEMSLVGPRPFPDYHLNRFPPAFQALRRKVVPGLTGLWQVSARSDGDLSIQEELDTYYIRNWSPWLDIYLIARTFTAVLFGKGAY